MDDAKRERLFDALRAELARGREASIVDSDVDPDLALERIAAYLDGSLFEDEARAVERDLAIDPRLRRLVEELRSDSEEGAKAQTGWKKLGLPVGLLTVAASILMGIFLLSSQDSGRRIVEVPRASRVVACRGEVVRVSNADGRVDPGEVLDVGDVLSASSRVSIESGAALEVFREDGVYELAGGTWRELTPSFGVTDRFLGAAPEREAAAGDTRSGGPGASPIRPVCAVLPVRPSFEWNGDVGEGARLVVDRIEGVVFSVEIFGDRMPFPEDAESLDRDVGYRWRVEDARGSILFRQTFSVASEAQMNDWRETSEAIRSSSVSADVEDLLLALVADATGLCEPAKAAATRLAERGSFDALRMLESRLGDVGRLRRDVVELLSAWDRTAQPAADG